MIGIAVSLEIDKKTKIIRSTEWREIAVNKVNRLELLNLHLQRKAWFVSIMAIVCKGDRLLFYTTRKIILRSLPKIVRNCTKGYSISTSLHYK